MSDQVKYLSPLQIAKRLGCRGGKVYAWIESGELRAINTSDPGKLPHYKVSPEWLADFERRRSVVIDKVPAQGRMRDVRKGVEQIY